jgi:hypothetical protein
MKAPNEIERGVAGGIISGSPTANQFDEHPGELHDMIVRAPGMPVTHTDCEAGAAIEFRRRVEIADGVDDMVEAARGGHFTDENEVGTSN